MKYYLIAGEASGDLHGANLMRALKKQDALAHFRFWGGDLMAAEGGQQVKHYRDTAYMGFFEVVTHLPAIFGNLRFCRQDLADYDPDVVILIDYPGFKDRKSTRLNSSHVRISYAVFCLKEKQKTIPSNMIAYLWR